MWLAQIPSAPNYLKESSSAWLLLPPRSATIIAITMNTINNSVFLLNEEIIHKGQQFYYSAF